MLVYSYNSLKSNQSLPPPKIVKKTHKEEYGNKI